MDNYKSLGYMISSINRDSYKYMLKEFQDLNLHGAGQVNIILSLKRHTEGISQEDLATELAVDKATISRMIMPLVKNGLVERMPNPRDKRAYILKLTEETQAKVPQIKERMRHWTTVLSNNLSEEDMEKLFSMLEIIKNNAEQYLKTE